MAASLAAIFFRAHEPSLAAQGRRPAPLRFGSSGKSRRGGCRRPFQSLCPAIDCIHSFLLPAMPSWRVVFVLAAWSDSPITLRSGCKTRRHGAFCKRLTPAGTAASASRRASPGVGLGCSCRASARFPRPVRRAAPPRLRATHECDAAARFVALDLLTRGSAALPLSGKEGP